MTSNPINAKNVGNARTIAINQAGSTDSIPEGSVNLYFTSTRVKASLPTTGGDVHYNSSSNIFNLTSGTYTTSALGSLTGVGTILATALGTRTLTINGVTVNVVCTN
jgi:hypothetical protein